MNLGYRSFTKLLICEDLMRLQPDRTIPCLCTCPAPPCTSGPRSFASIESLRNTKAEIVKKKRIEHVLHNYSTRVYTWIL